MDRQNTTSPLWRHLQRLENLSVVFRQTDGRSRRTPASTQPGRQLPLVQGMLTTWQSETVGDAPEFATTDGPLIETAVSPAPLPPTQPVPTINRQSEPDLSARPSASPAPMAPSVAASAYLDLDDDPDWPILQRIVQAHRQKASEAGESGTPPTQTPPEDAPRLGEEASAEFAQPVSLDQAWPVTRHGTKTIARTEATAVTLPHTDPAIQPASSHHVADQTMIQAQIAQISPEKPTDAAIEFAPPRRPRPLAASSPRSAPPSSTLQRQKVAMVPTEIGPLPADLWQLLDETPPQPDTPDTNAPTINPITAVAAPSGDSPTTPPILEATSSGRWHAAPAAQRAAARPNADDVLETVRRLPESDPARQWGQAAVSSSAHTPESLDAAAGEPETAHPTGQIAPSSAWAKETEGLETAVPSTAYTPKAHASTAQPVQRQETSLQAPAKAPSLQRAVQTPLSGDGDANEEKTDRDPAVPATPAAPSRLLQIGAVDSSELASEAPVAVQRAEDLSAANGGSAMPELAGSDLGKQADEETAVSPAPDQPDLNAIAQQVFRQLRQRLRLEWERERGRAGL